MKTTIALLLAMLSPCWLSGQEDADPFAPIEPGVVVPPGADIDPFVPAGEADEADEADDVHRWNDQVVKPGDSKGPDHASIGGWFDERLDRVGIVFRVGLQHYKAATGHPDLNRGVALISGEPGTSDLWTLLRPFQVAGDTATFIVIGSRKQLAGMHLVFIPREGKRRYLYHLGCTAQDIIESEDTDHRNQPNKPRQSDPDQSPSFDDLP
jgi:hypothetical protein